MDRTPGALSALKHRDYRYYWLGQCVSLMGTSMQSAALAWLVYTVTGSPTLLGTLAVFQFGPLLALSLPAGVFVDRWPKRRTMMITQTVFMLQAFALAILVFSGRASYRMILPLASIYGVAQAFDYPCRRSFLVDLVGKEDLRNAISLNSTASSLTRIIGPSVAGVVMVKLGGGWAFLLNAVSYLAVIAGLAMITVDGKPAAEQEKKRIVQELVQGLRYIWSSDTIRVTMVMGLAVMIFGLNENVLVPVFADRVLHLGAEGYGALMSAVAIGAFIGALTSTALSHKAVSGQVLLGAGLAVGLAQVVLFATSSFWLGAVMLAVVGLGGVLFSITMYSTVQTHAAAQFRGRVMSVNALVETGTMPLGNAFAGAVMGAWGAPMGFLLCGGVSVVALAGIVVAQLKVVRRSLFASL